MTRRTLPYLIPLILFAALAVYLAAGLTRDPHQLPSVLVGKPVPVFALPPLPGFDHGLASADLATGEPQLLNVFASWCPPCRAEQPVLLRLASEQRVTLRGLNYKDKPDEAVAWLTRYGNPFRSIGADPNNRVAIDFGVYGAPESFIIDGQGHIRYRHVGPLTPADVEQTILPLIAALRR